MGHHAGRGRDDASVDDLVGLIRRSALARSSRRPRRELVEKVAASGLLSYVDELLPVVAQSGVTADGLRDLALDLATNGTSAEPVKLGISLLGLCGLPEDLDLVLTLGRHEEFTLFCAVAAGRIAGPGGRTLATRSRHSGWGRSGGGAALSTERPEIQDWLVRDGFRNSIMDEYLAYEAATTGRLLERLTDGEPDDSCPRCR